MSLPNNTLSSIPLESAFLGSRGASVNPLVDYEDGGIDFNDPSEGHFYQWWRARVVDNTVVVDAEHVEEQVLYTGTEITEVSLTFDQNMRPCLAFVDNGRAYLQWYDTSVSQQVVTDLGSTVITPRVTLDDKRSSQSSNSDIVLAYLKEGTLRVRQQRDRFGIEYDPTLEVPEPMRTQYRQQIAQSPGLVKIGMGHNLRVMFQLLNPLPTMPPQMPECNISGDLVWPE